MSSPAVNDGEIQHSQESAIVNADTPNTTPPAPDTVSESPSHIEDEEEDEEQPDTVMEGNEQEHEIEADAEDEEHEQSMTLPLAKIKRIFKLDSDFIAASQSSVYATGLATELFIQYFVEQASLLAKMDKRKKIQYKDFAAAVSSHDALMFLSETVPKTYTLSELVNKKLVNIDSPNEISDISNGFGSNTETVTEQPIKNKKSPPVLAKGQQTLRFSTPKESEVPPIRKAVIHDLVGQEEDNDVVMLN
ncbi:DNA polymerase epsilon subunit C [Scheffersomyces amazonensis]|uniref:DNA polymerase epsilon subunit C n=1 Tax=Scheffersomyces amazonensis TaxID=1078765 RepID=UPI00315DCD6D